MNIHELNNFTGTLGSGAYLAIDDGTDTGKISSQGLLAATEARIDNIIAGPAPSAEEIVDARLGADGVTYPSLGGAIRGQVTDLKSALTDETNARILLAGRMTTAEGDIDTLETHKVAQPLDEYNQPTDGTDGQLLRTKGDGTTEWADVGLPTDEQTAQAVSDWLDNHPEATTTVQDGSLTEPKFSSALKLKTIKDYVTPEMFGAVGDGITDDSEAIKEAFQHDRVYLAKKTYKVTETINVDSCEILSDGAEIIGNVSGFILKKSALSLESLGSPLSDLVVGDTIAPVNSLNDGEDIGIYSTDLFNPARAYYNHGEFNSVKFGGALEHGYYADYVAANTTVYRVSFGKLSIKGLTVKNTNTDVSSGAVSISGISRSKLDGLNTYSNGGYASLEIDRCYKISIHGIFEQSSSVAHGQDYGIAIINSQDVIVNCQAIGFRHGITVGGSSLPLNIVNRNIIIGGVFGNYAGSSLGDINLHGNAEYCEISGICNNGVIIAGRNHIVHDIEINSQNGYGIRCYEQLDGDFIISNCLINSDNYIYAILFASDTTTGNPSNVIISNCVFHGLDTAIVGLNGASTDYINVVIKNIICDSPSTYVVNDQRSTHGSYLTADETVSNYKTVNCYIKKLLAYTDTKEIQFSAESLVLPTITWSAHQNKGIPYIRLFCDNPTISGHALYFYVYDRSYGSFRIVCRTLDGTAVTGSINIRYEVYYLDF